MPLFTYMGTKRLLASYIATAAEELTDGPFMDLFSGVSAVGTALAPLRNVWCNDAQSFSTLLTGALYTSKSNNVDPASIALAISAGYDGNRDALRSMLKLELELEAAAIHGSSVDRKVEIHSHIASALRARAAELRATGLHCLFSSTHSGTYFGLAQCVDIDSIRAGADAALASGAITDEQHRWSIIALCKAASATSNSTGHFAQYLTPKPTNINRVLSKRKRSVFSQWAEALELLEPLGSKEWRSGNKVFRDDAVSVAWRLQEEPVKPGVLYADPPYTDDQYSRYYHILENVVLYDYPEVVGKGEYRPGRFVSRFSLAGQVSSAFKELVEASAHLPSSFMLSYPSNGLLLDAGDAIPSLLADNFEVVRDPISIAHEHSTLGASKGAQKHQVTEHIYIAQRGRWSGANALPRRAA